jgi:hypothetical protein
VEIAARLDELIQDRITPELTPEEMGMLQKNYQEFHQKRMEEEHSVKKAVVLEADEIDGYKLFE